MSWTHIEDTTQKARKEHRCYLCNQPITIGMSYVRRFGIDDDGKMSMKMHRECEEYSATWDEDDWEYGGLGPEFREAMAEWQQDKMEKAEAKAAEEKLKAMRADPSYGPA